MRRAVPCDEWSPQATRWVVPRADWPVPFGTGFLMCSRRAPRGDTMFKPVDTKQSFPKLEEDVLRFWKENGIFRKSVEERPEERTYVFYEGPPTANADRKSTRLNSSHVEISYAVFCLKKKKKT